MGEGTPTVEDQLGDRIGKLRQLARNEHKQQPNTTPTTAAEPTPESTPPNSTQKNSSALTTEPKNPKSRRTTKQRTTSDNELNPPLATSPVPLTQTPQLIKVWSKPTEQIGPRLPREMRARLDDLLYIRKKQHPELTDHTVQALAIEAFEDLLIKHNLIARSNKSG